MGVYSKNAMPLAFRCYTDALGQDVMTAWYWGCDPAIRGEFVGFIQTLEASSRAANDLDLCKPLTKRAASRCVGLHELRFDTEDGRCFRILGSLDEGVFTMLYPFEKRRDQPESSKYAEPCELAHERRAEIARDGRRSEDCGFPPPEPAGVAH